LMINREFLGFELSFGCCIFQFFLWSLCLLIDFQL
jgi:hypothetical protein